ncbi:MAG: glycosyltransferase family 9 protein [Deltaproteobacteria bacterium]|jgi:ADP-heptose:LPS heptosyltransferase|nr:glycosyltransferase family 9 protein [Deltaproteobacteria bacterium]
MARHLVIQLARFGDIVQTKRLLLSLAATPGDEVHLAVDGSLAPLARTLYPFAVVHAIRAHASGAGAAEIFAHNREAFASLAAADFTSVYTLNFSGMAFALAGLFDPDSLRGYTRRKGQDLRSSWLRMGFRWMGDRRIAPLNLVDFWAYLHADPIPPDKVNPEASDRRQGKIAIVAAGRESRRSLPAQVLAPLVEAIFAARGGPEIVILGSNAERPFAHRLARLLRPAVLQKVDDACGRTALTDLPAILSECDMALTPDTGVMHLAAHLGVPVRAFFLSSAWCFETGPYGAGHTVFQSTRPCAPCVETRPCPCNAQCLAPFAEPGLAAAVRETEGQPLRENPPWPEGLALLRTRLDAFGCDYVPVRGGFAELPRRKALRALLAEFTGRGDGRDAAAWCADTVFHETDWMLPPPAMDYGAPQPRGRE